ncbi:hypothetical protein [Croceibacterium aestuarii]|nr:hypothetical protein [Croceibacterium sp. D39]
MTAFSNIASKAATLFAAMGMTTFLLTAYFYMPSTQIVSGMVA